MTVLTAQLEDGAHYGRLERDAVVSPGASSRPSIRSQLAIGEINTGLYCFDIARLRAVLRRSSRMRTRNLPHRRRGAGGQ